MHDSDSRVLTQVLAEDLAWLEQHGRGQAEGAETAARLRLAAALVRGVIGPFLEGRPAPPVHVAVVGGAGAGKSTVANMLSGAAAAEANPQAGFTRHPVAFVSEAAPFSWNGDGATMGALRHRREAAPASLDEDVYQVRRVPADSFGLPAGFVVWDCPDMTTWAATGYVSRLLEIAGLADVLVYVASDERYNDAVPTQYLELLVQTGKPVVACLVKMHEDHVTGLMEHFRQEVLARMAGRVVDVLAIPHLEKAELAEPSRASPRYRVPLLNQVQVLGSPPQEARRRSVRGAQAFLVAQQEKLVAVARDDVDALQGWRELVRQGRVEFDSRYVREYLTTSKFRHFDEAMVRLIEMLDLPGVGKYLSNALWAIRTPYRWVRGLVGKALARPEAPALPERVVMEEALSGWLDLLRKEATRRADRHGLWRHVAEGFSRGQLPTEARERFEQAFRTYQVGLAGEVDTTAQAIYGELEKKPVLLNTLRGGKFALDAAAIAAALIAGGPGLSDIVLVPLAASVTHQLVELLGQQYVEGQREQARRRQQAVMTEHVSRPLAEWLTAWPATGGSSFERLQTILGRLPGEVDKVGRKVQERLAAVAAAGTA